MSKKAATWTMRDGTVVKVSEMEISHIKNVIAMLERKGLLDESRRSIKAMRRRLAQHQKDEAALTRKIEESRTSEEFHERLEMDLEREDDGILGTDWC